MEEFVFVVHVLKVTIRSKKQRFIVSHGKDHGHHRATRTMTLQGTMKRCSGHYYIILQRFNAVVPL